MTRLLNEIARCPHVQFCIQNPSVEYPCRQVVFSQSPSTLNEYQVKEAEKHCVETYLQKVWEIASARVVVVLGRWATEAMHSQFEIPKDVALFAPIAIRGREKLITFLPHPNARKVRSFAKCLKSDQLESLRAFLR
ncbi:hypothetical protein [Microseira wollei]|uniref:Uracil-DNA glycosylase-like domain-containing protein n=1 Tax=Microseira wollei NIES-4236 TaxID=2530354 RepID=A0AAV3XM92_9CYAN|nr:hypothetical protein [Microseira wollei]GET41587.1 hypothetical protein MiSe_63990 [Microseira wollei NIES-4236]